MVVLNIKFDLNLKDIIDDEDLLLIMYKILFILFINNSLFILLLHYNSFV